MKRNCLVLQSGGPTCAINSSLYGIIKNAKEHPNQIDNIYGSLNGIEGLLKDELIDLGKEKNEELSYLKNTPGAILGTARHQLSNNMNDNEYLIILNQCLKYDIRYLFLIGGNDSMDTANKINKYFICKAYDCKVIGVPKTIDNDLVITDHTPGYGSAAKFIANTFAEIENDISCYEKGKVTIVEVMGRDAGWLTAASKLASLNSEGPDLIYLPEIPFNIDDFLNKVKDIYSHKKHALIAVSEGIKDANGEYIQNLLSLKDGINDSFGHANLGGVSEVLSLYVSNKLKLPTRHVELSLPQRCASHISSLMDIKEAEECGKKAIEFALNNQTGVMITMIRNGNYSIKYEGTDLNKVANKVKYFPSKWIVNNSDISKDFIAYILPLVQGETPLTLLNGLPKYAKLEKIRVR